MTATRLALKNIGPIRRADVCFGDLTVLVGPQATGKSILLQFLRLLLDSGPIFAALKKHGFDWERNPRQFLELYLGEGTGDLWDLKSSALLWKGADRSLEQLLGGKQKNRAEKSFLIPAQRVLTLSREGWLRAFSDYRSGDPFSVRDFSEKLRMMMEAGLGRGEAIYPQPKRLKNEIRDIVSRSIFSGFTLELDKSGPQKRLVLSGGQPSTKLPFMVWSAGQREFVPLLLGLYYLLPPTKIARRGSVEWVIIEELEMGLHPEAIQAVLLIVLELLWRGYRVCLSTHSPDVLDLIWALRNIREARKDGRTLMRIFHDRPSPSLVRVGDAALRKETKVYFFEREEGKTHDISALDPASQRKDEWGWGGLTEFSSRVSDLVADAVHGARIAS
jgi:hypothetical protein